ncbi:cytochrome c [uncultured Pelagimonas sp.]|uniref:c-type cytochrome n=1 Tax=uncultured Pelagimonas sp. TaxID=1618102 RepID=UPI00262B072A|nr:cytochrome c [uncultured Pelagimonas sp.]
MLRTFSGLIGCLTLVACVEAEMPQASDGKALFMENCAACHGENGKGDGPMARAMTPAPKDLTLIQVRNGDKFPESKVLSSIDGYARSDLAGPGMPEFGGLLEGDLIPYDSGDGIETPTPRKLLALLAYIESIQETR